MCRLFLANQAFMEKFGDLPHLTKALAALETNGGGDGNGVMVLSKNGHVYTEKGVSLDTVYSASLMTYYRQAKWVAFHTRIASCGTVASRNCHPFRTSMYIGGMNGSEMYYDKMAALLGNITDSEVILRTFSGLGIGLDGFKGTGSSWVGFHRPPKKKGGRRNRYPWTPMALVGMAFPLYFHTDDKDHNNPDTAAVLWSTEDLSKAFDWPKPTSESYRVEPGQYAEGIALTHTVPPVVSKAGNLFNPPKYSLATTIFRGYSKYPINKSWLRGRAAEVDDPYTGEPYSRLYDGLYNNLEDEYLPVNHIGAASPVQANDTKYTNMVKSIVGSLMSTKSLLPTRRHAPWLVEAFDGDTCSFVLSVESNQRMSYGDRLEEQKASEGEHSIVAIVINKKLKYKDTFRLPLRMEYVVETIFKKNGIESSATANGEKYSYINELGSIGDRHRLKEVLAKTPLQDLMKAFAPSSQLMVK